MIVIGTTRFSDQTWEENKKWRESNKAGGCAYGLPCKIPVNISKRAKILVIEMNNTHNKVMGVGLVNNAGKRGIYRIYSDHYYNRYIYEGEKRVDREKMVEGEKMVELEKLLFKGKGHMKRGRGITRVSLKKLKKGGLDKYLRGLFDKV
ncbi:uncharacterized protein METZ01_LOCUS340815 [marine metagenome]|uniref:Uncharacterized protein n=1 Tax=marine metagenome TaxID=408172 RepID=A0A382QUF6_9ZZZZ